MPTNDHDPDEIEIGPLTPGPRAIARVGDPDRPQCGACAHKVWVSDQIIDCWGVPPTPCIVGLGTNLAGQQGIKAELLRPRIPASTPCCSLFAWGGEIPVLGETQPIGRS